MKIQRDRSNLSFRRRTRRRGGALPLTLALGVLIGVAVASWDWIDQRLGWFTPLQQTNGDLRGAHHAFDRGDLGEAINQARTFYAANPEATDALTLLVRALVYRSYDDYDRGGDRAEALRLTTAAVERLPGDLDTLAVHAFALQAAGHPNEAVREAARVLNRNPQHGLARVALSLGYTRSGMHQIALQEGQVATGAADWRLDALRAVAISLNNLGRHDEAVTIVEQATSLNNRLLLLHFEHALYAIRAGDHDAATAAYFRVLAFDAENVKARLRMCELSSLLRERDTAIRYCQEVTERAPSWEDGWHRLGREYYLQGDFMAAQTTLHRCASLQNIKDVPYEQRHFDCWYLRGQAAEILGDCDGLMAAYNEFRVMADAAPIAQTWTYPPEGPAVCAESPQSPEPDS